MQIAKSLQPGDGLKFALVGSAPSSIRGAPYQDPTWNVWGCSPGAYGVVPRGRSNVWWELHKYEPGQTWFSPEYCQFLRDHPCVIVAEQRKEIPNGLVLDYPALVKKYSAFFFTSSIAWMMAHAIEVIEKEGADPKLCKIGLWGVDMAANEEYEAQRAGLHYFALIAAQKGIEVGVPPESDLFRPRFLYGVDEITHFHIKLRARREELIQRKVAAEQMAAAKTHEAAFLTGALDDLNYCFHTWPDKESTLGPPTLSVPIVGKPLEPATLETTPVEAVAAAVKGNGLDHSQAVFEPVPSQAIAGASLGKGNLI